MLDTIAKTAVVGSAISLFRRLSGRPEPSTYVGAVGLVLAGVVVGAAAALLFAPKSGAELRSDVRKRARQLTAGAQERLERVRDAAKSEAAAMESH